MGKRYIWTQEGSLALDARSARAPWSRALMSAMRVGVAVALMSLSAGVSIPLEPVPLTFQILMLAFTVAYLGPREAFAAMAIYVAIGAMGAPVFSGCMGGIGKLLGPSGGFICGFAPAALAGSIVRVALERLFGREGEKAGTLGRLGAVMLGAVVATAVCHLIGWAWLMAVSGLSPLAAFAAANAPFIALDAAKCAFAAGVAAGVEGVRRLLA